MCHKIYVLKVLQILPQNKTNIKIFMMVVNEHFKSY